MHLTLRRLGLSQRELARQSGLNRAAVGELVAHGRWPVRATPAVRADVLALLRQAGASTAELRGLALPAEPEKEMAPSAPTPGADPQIAINQNPTGEEPMLLQYTPISEAARKQFGLPRSPFVDDVLSLADVYQSASSRYARAALMDAARNHGFMALVGESGAGKTTLVEALEQRLLDEGQDVAIIRPYVLGMEASDARGKTLRATHIAEAIAYALDPQLKIKSSPQARFEQLHQLLKASARAGRRHLLVIDEAHCLPVATLKHLKRFLELKDGLRRVIGVVLVAQPELRALLHSQNPDVREVMQRCEIVELEPLDNDLEGYLAHKFARFELRCEQVFEPDAFDAIRARLIYTPRGAKAGISTCYPLAVHNLVARAMNAACAAGWPKVDAQCVAGC
ncbi:MAG: ExeA protein [Burkholderiales bacterium 68-10]|nr:MAG: ExeA protein [Burkholderiales bacterium 68-10]